MSTLINEGRGIIWFPQSFGGKCSGGNSLRAYQYDKGYACADSVKAAGEVGRQIQSLAPVLNTQSYQHGFASVHSYHVYKIA